MKLCYIVTLRYTSMWGTRFKEEQLVGIEVYQSKSSADSRLKGWSNGQDKYGSVKQAELKE